MLLVLKSCGCWMGDEEAKVAGRKGTEAVSVEEGDEGVLLVVAMSRSQKLITLA